MEVPLGEISCSQRVLSPRHTQNMEKIISTPQPISILLLGWAYGKTQFRSCGDHLALSEGPE